MFTTRVSHGAAAHQRGRIKAERVGAENLDTRGYDSYDGQLGDVASYASFGVDCRCLLSATFGYGLGGLVQREVYESEFSAFVAIPRSHGTSWLNKSVLLAALILMIGGGLAHGQPVTQGERPTPEQIRQMFPRRHNLVPEPPEGYKLPFYRWREGTPIDVFIVTANQRGPCVDAIKTAIQRQISLIRQEVPALRNIRDAKVTDWVPKEKATSAILIGLDTDDPRIGPAMAKYMAENRPKAKIITVDSSTGGDRGYRGSNDPPDAEPIYANYHQDGFAIEQDHIVLAYAWSVHLRGLRIYSEAECRDFYWDSDLDRILGGENLVPGLVTGWLTKMAPPERQRWNSLAHRLFLNALYGCPDSPARRECVETSLLEFWNRRKND